MLTAIPFSMQFYRTLQCCKLSYHAMLPLFCIGPHCSMCCAERMKGPPCPYWSVRSHAGRRACIPPKVWNAGFSTSSYCCVKVKLLEPNKRMSSICHASFKLKPVAWTRKWLQRRPALETHSSLGESELSGKFPCNFLRDSDHHWQSPPHWSSNDHHSVQAEQKRKQNDVAQAEFPSNSP